MGNLTAIHLLMNGPDSATYNVSVLYTFQLRLNVTQSEYSAYLEKLTLAAIAGHSLREVPCEEVGINYQKIEGVVQSFCGRGVFLLLLEYQCERMLRYDLSACGQD